MKLELTSDIDALLVVLLDSAVLRRGAQELDAKSVRQESSPRTYMLKASCFFLMSAIVLMMEWKMIVRRWDNSRGRRR
jgi:hypothetical protein